MIKFSPGHEQVSGSLFAPPKHASSCGQLLSSSHSHVSGSLGFPFGQRLLGQIGGDSSGQSQVSGSLVIPPGQRIVGHIGGISSGH